MKISIPNSQGALASSILNLENRFGKNLPQSYLNFLHEHDGAKPQENVFMVGEGHSAGIEQFITAHECINIQNAVEGFPKNVVPIARVTSGNFVYLNPETGIIYFWDHELDADFKIADSFDNFLNQLQPFEASQVQLKPGQVKKVWVDPKFKPEF